MAAPARFERATYCLGGSRSIHLGYGVQSRELGFGAFALEAKKIAGRQKPPKRVNHNTTAQGPQGNFRLGAPCRLRRNFFEKRPVPMRAHVR